jgi:hypothetical protein
MAENGNGKNPVWARWLTAATSFMFALLISTGGWVYRDMLGQIREAQSDTQHLRERLIFIESVGVQKQLADLQTAIEALRIDVVRLQSNIDRQTRNR